MSLGLGTVGDVITWALRLGTSSNVEGEAEDAVERGNGTEVVVVSPESMVALRATDEEWGKRLRTSGARAWSGARHEHHLLQRLSISIVRAQISVQLSLPP